jgi:18S rRNA (guanine1575-N7)-methyltransferase
MDVQAGFSGGLVIDYPHSTRAKKFFLVLMVGPSMVNMPQVGTGLTGLY